MGHAEYAKDSTIQSSLSNGVGQVKAVISSGDRKATSPGNNAWLRFSSFADKDQRWKACSAYFVSISFCLFPATA
ncbi:hypothetical protein Hypma_014173 [Hypsizygus marmoreus]|uniref:Uncharacterized protein n=1 Tax=Hypsizygus marmoreus TaxID=39966 RepID=A0A369K7T2_HYPMA|nr:hypothetical protein Hypma_014173 [Hypsizygus marmoreus]